MDKQPPSATGTAGFEPPKPKLEYMARFTVELCAPVVELGKTNDLGQRRIIPITGGTVEGPMLTAQSRTKAPIGKF